MTDTTPSGADALRDKLISIIADHLSGTYHCRRVWSAWSYGTMSQDDFEDVGESDTPAELADAIMAALSAAQEAPQPSAQIGLTEDQLDAIRFRALCEDHENSDVRTAVRELIDRLPVMSLSAARRDIDALFTNKDMTCTNGKPNTLQSSRDCGEQADTPTHADTSAVHGERGLLTPAGDSRSADQTNVQPAAQQWDALSYVHPVPDHCDRVVWRNRYLHLAAQAQEAAPAAQGEPSAWHRIEEDAEVDVPLDTDLLLAWWDQWSEAWKIEVNHAGSERGGWRHGRATHWRPLPAPPSAAQQKGASNG